MNIIPNCQKTVTKKHLFMPIQDTQIAKIWELHGVKSPLQCIACNIIDDTDPSEERWTVGQNDIYHKKENETEGYFESLPYLINEAVSTAATLGQMINQDLQIEDQGTLLSAKSVGQRLKVRYSDLKRLANEMVRLTRKIKNKQ